MILLQDDARTLSQVDSDSVSCIVTSPPYNVGIKYDDYVDFVPWEEYGQMASDAAEAMARVLMPGGRAWVNVQPTVPHKPGDNSERVDLECIWKVNLLSAGLRYRDTVAWVQDSFDGACAWGSWLRPSAPNQRGGWESIICVYKDHWKRTPPDKYKNWKDERHALGGDWGNDLCRNVWKIKPARASESAPAPFPVEIPARAIRLSSWPEEHILDPFGGSGTTARVADELGRVGISVVLKGGSDS